MSYLVAEVEYLGDEGNTVFHHYVESFRRDAEQMLTDCQWTDEEAQAHQFPTLAEALEIAEALNCEESDLASEIKVIDLDFPVIPAEGHMIHEGGK